MSKPFVRTRKLHLKQSITSWLRKNPTQTVYVKSNTNVGDKNKKIDDENNTFPPPNHVLIKNKKGTQTHTTARPSRHTIHSRHQASMTTWEKDKKYLNKQHKLHNYSIVIKFITHKFEPINSKQDIQRPTQTSSINLKSSHREDTVQVVTRQKNATFSTKCTNVKSNHFL